MPEWSRYMAIPHHSGFNPRGTPEDITVRDEMMAASLGQGDQEETLSKDVPDWHHWVNMG